MCSDVVGKVLEFSVKGLGHIWRLEACAAYLLLIQCPPVIPNIFCMAKKYFLFVTTLLVATSASIGYDANDFLKGDINVASFLDWFSISEKYIRIKGLIVFDLIPALFLIIQTIIFFQDGKKTKGFFSVLALVANLIGVFFLMQKAYPIASEISNWTGDKLPSNWISVKDDWLKYIGLSGLMGVVGWLLFLITFFVPKTNNTEIKRLNGFLSFIKNALALFLTFVLGLSIARLYAFCFFPVSYDISGATFIEMHRPLDLAIRKVGQIVFVVMLTLEMVLATLFFIEKSRKKAWLIIGVIVFLLCDTFIALQYNRPLNDLFLTWTPTTMPTNWSDIRDKWLSYHLFRDIFMLLGFVCILLTFFIPKNRKFEER